MVMAEGPDRPAAQPAAPLTALRSGRIAYRAADGSEIGRERFEIVSHAGGHVLRAWCEMDEVALTRDVTLAMDARWRPTDGFCRLHRGGVPDAALWFDVSEREVRVNGRIGARSLAEERVPTQGRLPYLGLHPLQGDALIVEARGTGSPGAFLPVQAVTNSISPNGDEALGAQAMTIDVAYHGIEEIVVAAGRFTARRYALRWREDWPAAELWVREQDCVFLKMRWALVEGWYELEEFDE